MRKALVLLSILALSATDCVTVSPEIKEAERLVKLAREECKELLELPKGNSRELRLVREQAEKRCKELTDMALQKTGETITNPYENLPPPDKK